MLCVSVYNLFVSSTTTYSFFLFSLFFILSFRLLNYNPLIPIVSLSLAVSFLPFYVFSLVSLHFFLIPIFFSSLPHYFLLSFLFVSPLPSFMFFSFHSYSSSSSSSSSHSFIPLTFFHSSPSLKHSRLFIIYRDSLGSYTSTLDIYIYVRVLAWSGLVWWEGGRKEAAQWACLLVALVYGSAITGGVNKNAPF